MTEMTHAEIKEKMIWAGKVLVNEGQDDFTRGHISFRLPDNPSLFFMKCHSLGLDEITHENILTIDLDGKVVAGTSRRHSEVYIHSEIFKVRPDVHCILHTHPTYSIAWSGTGRPLKALSQPDHVLTKGDVPANLPRVATLTVLPMVERVPAPPLRASELEFLNAPDARQIRIDRPAGS